MKKIIFLFVVINLFAKNTELNDLYNYTKKNPNKTYLLASINSIFAQLNDFTEEKSDFTIKKIEKWDSITELVDNIQYKYDIETATPLYFKGLNYYLGFNSVKINTKTAFDFMKNSSLLGYNVAMAWLGVMYYDGIGVAKNEYYGKQWIQRAFSANLLENVANGDKEAEIILSVLYDKGLSVIKNPEKYYNFSINNIDNSIALCNLGEIYYYGKFVSPNLKESINYFQKSAEMGNALAQNWLGYIYKQETQVFNPFKSFYWFSKSAEQNDNYGMRNLAELYFDGIGNTKDLVLSYEWFMKSAENEDVKAMSWIGYMNHYAYGVEKNIKTAREWYKKASDLGDLYSSYNLGLTYFEETKYKEAIEWFEIAASKEYIDALVKLGEMYFYGQGLTVSDEKGAFDYFFIASSKGNAKAQSWIGYMYHYGKGATVNISEARKWYQKAVEQGDKYSIHNMGLTYYESRDYTTAKKWFSRIEVNNYASSILKLGEIYFNGYGVSSDYLTALKYFKAAADLNDIIAQSWMGYCYQYGYGVSIDFEEAKKWYQKAANQGDSYSVERLKEIQ